MYQTNHVSRNFRRGLLLAGFTFSFLTTALAQELKYTNGNNNWNADSLGNHRAVVTFNGSGSVARVVIPWRRRDEHPELKRIIIEDTKTKQKITNVKVLILNRERGDICFEPTSGKGDYYIYYLPSKNEGRDNYPKGVYLAPEQTADNNWLQSIHAGIKPNTIVKQLEAIDSFNTFYPMEVIATEAERKQLLLKHPGGGYMLFPEDRQFPIKMTDDLPQRWIKKGPSQSFSGTADKGEYYAFQLGIYARREMKDVQISFADLKTATGQAIPAAQLNCINTTGTTYDAKPFSAKVDIPPGKVQAMWCGIDVPENAAAGIYKGIATIRAEGMPAMPVRIALTVTNKRAVNSGFNEPWKQTRLKWLNSTLAQDDAVIAPYTPLELKDSVISLLGRKVGINKDGFPAQIQTFFTPEMTSLSTQPKNIFTEPVHFHFIEAATGKDLHWQSNGWQITQKAPGKISWKALNTTTGLEMEVTATLEFDGFLDYTVKVTAQEEVALKDITMHLPFDKGAAKYMMGLNQKGGVRPEKIDWKWDVKNKNQDGAWIGDVNAGIQFNLRDENYVRPLNTNFYLQKPLLLPLSWGNGDKGGITIGEKGKSILVNSYSGERTLHKGEVLYYNFHLIITPFHPINTDFQWSTRFYHRYNNLDSIKATGATVVNIHHGNDINPWINYPFIEWKAMKDYITEAHQRGLKVKIYNTVRELSNHAWETFPLRSLGHEVYSPGKGGGFSWLQEHVGKDYIAAWFVPEFKDAAIINSGMNRWHNYYVEGMNWLVQNVGIDGIYLDDVAFDRVTMKRVKRVLTKDNHPGIIDLHSANQYNKSDGFINSAVLYMEHFPYLNRLWFGEYFDYEKNDPAFFLTEVSGIPFGLMGEMLQDGGNQWRGMVYGMTNRMPWTATSDPRPIWKVWDDFGMQGTKMIGYWVENNPVKTSNPLVPATIYRKDGAVLVSLASWAPENTTVKLTINWKALGIDSARAVITAPDIRNFQQGQVFGKNADIPVEKNKGWLLIIK
ncbi:glycoside hydrolase domain-containing protein [Chitinophaga polysaccharea]|uniref:glycoside hydrolase domain-containing protein n=1 Tax=Chitinophaga polysaccharea TaxID=1293035 RepID=UPI001C8E9A33|nr:glycoside hydrolase domain-containing protein [Chitinophaga polysaccharea]